MSKELPLRSEVPVEDTWNLSDLFKSEEEWEQTIKDALAIVAGLKKYEGSLCASAANLYDALKKNEEADYLLTKAYEYAARLSDQDTGDNHNSALEAKAYSAFVKCGTETAFFDPELVAVSDEQLEKFYSELKDLEFYRMYIDEIRRTREHSLSPECEKLLASAGNVTKVPEDAYSFLSDADLEFPKIEDENGEKVRITHGRFVRLLESADRRVRKDTFEALYNTYKQFKNTFACLYEGQVKSLIFRSRARKYESTLVAAVDRNNVSPVVYRTLIDTVNKNLDKLHAYVGLRKKLLGVDVLHMYDIYTPMVNGVSRQIPFAEAKETVLKALAPLGSDYTDIVKYAFEHRWLDVYENKGKRSGAYSAGMYGVHPYVLLNYNGALDEMFTLAHEMGHAMHSYHSDHAQPYIYSGYKIFVAEVASTCNEVLLLEYLLKNTTDRKERAYLLNHYLDMFKGTLFRQTQFAEFELRSNELAEAGESLNADALCKLYKQINEKYYGPSMISDEGISFEWERIPHFYYDYYVYQYATSFSAAVAIAHDILRDGEPVVAKYKKFLSSGCTKPPVELLRDLGIDLETPKPVQDAMDVMAGVIRELEELTQ